MSFPIIERPKGEYCICNGEKIHYGSETGKLLMSPVEDTIYYESIRFRDYVMVFFEDHMLRLYRSVMAKEAFDFDSELIYEQAEQLIRDQAEGSDGNLRIVLTRDTSVVHLSDAVYPDPCLFQKGIVAATLEWERVEPQIKVFRGDYKTAGAERLNDRTSYGIPYEVILVNSDGKITEGSRSNFFVLHGDTVYSPPESTILIGITRKYVMKALSEASLHYEERTFSLDEISKMRDDPSFALADTAVFVTSSPFDILPIASIDDERFLSSENQSLIRISEAYMRILEQYIDTRRIPVEPGQ
jgi:branched-chain amino acid aminotransferase